jgi:hypothetical protein
LIAATPWPFLGKQSILILFCGVRSQKLTKISHHAHLQKTVETCVFDDLSLLILEDDGTLVLASIPAKTRDWDWQQSGARNGFVTIRIFSGRLTGWRFLRDF